jgi:hypothetical protein
LVDHLSFDDDTLAMLRQELARADLQIYSVVVMAQRDLEAGRFAAVLARLKVDADKLRMHASPLNDWLRQL